MLYTIHLIGIFFYDIMSKSPNESNLTRIFMKAEALLQWVSWKWLDGATLLERKRLSEEAVWSSFWLSILLTLHNLQKHTKSFSASLGKQTLLFHRNSNNLQFGGGNLGIYSNLILFHEIKDEMPIFTCLEVGCQQIKKNLSSKCYFGTLFWRFI